MSIAKVCFLLLASFFVFSSEVSSGGEVFMSQEFENVDSSSIDSTIYDKVCNGEAILEKFPDKKFKKRSLKSRKKKYTIAKKYNVHSTPKVNGLKKVGKASSDLKKGSSKMSKIMAISAPKSASGNFGNASAADTLVFGEHGVVSSKVLNYSLHAPHQEIKRKNEVGVGVSIGRNIGHSLHTVGGALVEEESVTNLSLYEFTVSLNRELWQSKSGGLSVLIGGFCGNKIVTGDFVSGNGMIFGVSSKLLMPSLNSLKTKGSVYFVPYVEGRLFWCNMSYESIGNVTVVSESVANKVMDKNSCSESCYCIRGEQIIHDMFGMYGTAIAGMRVTAGNVVISVGARVDRDFQDVKILDGKFMEKITGECLECTSSDAVSVDRMYKIESSSINNSGSTSLYGVIELSYRF
ncbi:hypothetical protein [Candidatus Fokinia crypta]|uniref:Uncharacterized protein n=1 Tax=Candidatus Fokinia crypta TaxID=1920990 RepID=A0ABZ0USC8_9RICK|nr:hypothetical protein [Candidatus Fokinia cryptica]WPX98176.1 hypothetical protein Fokcrypt_00717 [Candidatus Fokinia cryptica]